MGHTEPVTIVPKTRAAALYGAAEASEAYYCNYGVNPDYRRHVEAGGMVVSGVGREGEIRIIELPVHQFFMATLFLPQARSTMERPHPLIDGYAGAVAARLGGDATNPSSAT